jgi:CubicO group peptidase (beta-lactamase class C family)
MGDGQAIRGNTVVAGAHGPHRPRFSTLRMVGLILCGTLTSAAASAAEQIQAGSVAKIVSSLEPYIVQAMKQFDSPGLAIGIVADDRLVYSKGFGVRSKSGSATVDTRTLFQIGSTTKAFLAASIAVMADRGKLDWNDRVIDRALDFQLHDPWVTHEFRIFDLLAQRSGLPPEVNDGLGLLGYPADDLIRSLRYVVPVSSFRSTFSYTNLTHILAGRIVAKAAGAPDWNAVLQTEFLDPLGMRDTSYTASAMEASANHAQGYRWTPQATIEVPFSQIFPYDFGGAGDINSNIEEMSRWVRLQLGKGSFEGHRLVSEANLGLTHRPRIAITDHLFYASGWVVQQTDNGDIVWHNGGTTSFGAFVGLLPNKNIGVVVLSNEVNMGLPDAIGLWTLDRLLGNPDADHVANKHKAAVAAFDAATKKYARPPNARSAPPADGFVGQFSNPAFGDAAVALDRDGLVLTMKTTGAALRLDSWDGSVLTAGLVPAGRFAAMAEAIGPSPLGFVQLQMDKDGKQNALRLTLDAGETYLFTRH